MAQYRTKKPKLKIPYYSEKDSKGHYEVKTIESKVIQEYTGYTFDRIENLTIFEYWLLIRDAVIYNYSQTDAGREYLEKCWLSEQTEPDREMLRKYFSKNKAKH